MRNLFWTGVLAVAVGGAGCSGAPDIEAVPVGADVQVTRDDGALVEGTLEAKDAETVTVKVGTEDRQVAVAEIADVRVVDETTPPEPPPMALFREVTVPAGTALTIEVRSTVDSGESTAGDAIEAALAEAVTIDGVEVLPAGSAVTGRVATAESAGRVSGRASLAIAFDRVTAYNEAYPISARFEATAESTKQDDAKTIGIGAAAGAGIGALIGGGKGAAIGSVVGGSAGTARVLTTSGDNIRLEEGGKVAVELAEALVVRVPVR